MKPANVRLLIFQGTTVKQRFTWSVQEDRNSAPEPVDITDCIVRMMIRENYSSPVILDASEYINVVDGAQGVIEVNIPADITAELKFDDAIYDIVVEFENGDRYRVIEGIVELSRQVTK